MSPTSCAPVHVLTHVFSSASSFTYLRTLLHVLRVVWWSQAPLFSPPPAARGGRWLQSSAALVRHARVHRHPSSVRSRPGPECGCDRALCSLRQAGVHPAESFGVVSALESAIVTRSHSCPRCVFAPAAVPAACGWSVGTSRRRPACAD